MRGQGCAVGRSTKHWECQRISAGARANTRLSTIYRNNSSSVNIRMIEIEKWPFVHGISTSISISIGRNSVENPLASATVDHMLPPLPAALISLSLSIDLPSNPVLLHSLVLFLLPCILIFYWQRYRFPSLPTWSIWVERNEPLAKTWIKIDIANHRDFLIASDIWWILVLAKSTPRSRWTFDSAVLGLTIKSQVKHRTSRRKICE